MLSGSMIRCLCAGLFVVLGGVVLALPGGVMAASSDARCPNGHADEWVRQGVIRVGYRVAAPPFSYQVTEPQASTVEANDDPWRCVAGYSIELCRKVLETVRQEFDASCARAPYRVELVPVAVGTAAGGIVPPARGPRNCSERPPPAIERFTALSPDTPWEQGVDMLCGATSMTLERMFDVDFSLITFITGAAFLYPLHERFETLADLAPVPVEGVPVRPRRVGVLAGGAAEDVLRSLIDGAGLDAARIEFAAVSSYAEVVERLIPVDQNVEPDLFAFFGDKEILLAVVEYAAAQRPEVRRLLALSASTFSYEPYALAFRRDNRLLRYYANKALVRLFSSEQDLRKLMQKSFPNRVLGDKLRMLFEIQRIPEGGRRAAPTAE